MPDADPSIMLNSDAEVSLRRIGSEGVPLLIVDNVLADPQAMVELAAASTFGAPVSPWYPGVNAPMPEAYLQALLPVLRPSLARAFGLPAHGRLAAMSFLALSTRRADQLLPRQRIPHYDQPDPGMLAMVHYLGRAQGGGTGFFRHLDTGFETVSPGRREAYMAAVDAELEALSDSLAGFAGPETPGYEMTAAVEACFNRLIVYPACVLHCALFDGARLSEDARTGRLTANSFVSAA